MPFLKTNAFVDGAGQSLNNTFWVVSQVNLSVVGRSGTITVNGYFNQESYEAGKGPLAGGVLTFTVSGGDEFDNSLGKALIDTQLPYVTTLEEYLKTVPSVAESFFNGDFHYSSITFEKATASDDFGNRVSVVFTDELTDAFLTTGVTIKKNGITQTISSAFMVPHPTDDNIGEIVYTLSAAFAGEDVLTWEYSGTTLKDVSAYSLTPISVKTVLNLIGTVLNFGNRSNSGHLITMGML